VARLTFPQILGYIFWLRRGRDGRDGRKKVGSLAEAHANYQMRRQLNAGT
jgi:hypothetical protein